MDKTRKAFVVLAAAVTAGNYAACGSNTEETRDAQAPDAASRADTQIADVASTPDKQAADAATVPDTQTPEVAAKADTPVAVDTSQDSVTMNSEASLPPPDTNPILSMPAGTVYDVLSRLDV